jgi:hypothetical protein
MANGGGGGRRRKGARRGKTKKKTKYLSLSRHLSQAAEVVVHRSESLSVEESLPPSAPSTEEAAQTLEDDGAGHEQQQLDPFALHPEAPSTLFAAAPSLNDILGASSFSSGGGSGGSSPCAPSPDASGGSGRFEGEEEDLARRALRGRERWVYCRSSSSSPSAATATTTTTTTTSSSCSSAASTGAASASARPPLLKLDYDEILAAWAGRGSLYIGAAPALAPPKLEPDSVSPQFRSPLPSSAPEGTTRVIEP